MNYKREYFLEIESSNQLNAVNSPILILKSEVISHKNKIFMKIYMLFLDEITEKRTLKFVVKSNDMAFDFVVSNIRNAESYNDDRVFGCVIELPVEINKDDYIVTLAQIIYDSRTVDLPDSQLILMSLDDQQKETKKNLYLKQNIPDYLFFPRVEEKYWHCFCGNVNSNDRIKCSNCSTVFEKNAEFVKHGLNKIFLKTYIKKNPISFNYTKSLVENIDNYLSPLEDFVIDRSELINEIGIDSELDKYISKYPLKINLEHNFKKNIDDYVAKLIHFGFERDKILEKINVEKLEKEQSLLFANAKKQKSDKRKKMISLSILGVFLLGFSLLYFLYLKPEKDRTMYNDAVNLYESGKVAEAQNILKNLPSSDDVRNLMAIIDANAKLEEFNRKFREDFVEFILHKKEYYNELDNILKPINQIRGLETAKKVGQIANAIRLNMDYYGGGYQYGPDSPTQIQTLYNKAVNVSYDYLGDSLKLLVDQRENLKVWAGVWKLTKSSGGSHTYVDSVLKNPKIIYLYINRHAVQSGFACTPGDKCESGLGRIWYLDSEERREDNIGKNNFKVFQNDETKLTVQYYTDYTWWLFPEREHMINESFELEDLKITHNFTITDYSGKLVSSGTRIYERIRDE